MVKQPKKRLKLGLEKKKDIIFYSIFMIWPMLQFVIFYIGVNANSILMSFQEISYVDISATGSTGGTTTFLWTFSQYIRVFDWFKGAEFGRLLSVSLKYYFFSLVIGLPLGLLFSFYIFKKLLCWKTFRVLLFLPSILSGVVMAAIFRFFTDNGIPVLVEKIWYNFILRRELTEPVASLLKPDSGTSFGAVIFFNIWISFGTSVLIYSNKMSGISSEIIESAHLDGAYGFKEFIYIVFPLSFSTVAVFFVTGFAQICSNQYNLYNMFGGALADNDLRNLGYYLFSEVSSKFFSGGIPQLPFYSAMSVVITVVAVPITLLVKRLLEKFGPSEE